MTLLLSTSGPTARLGLAQGDRIIARAEFTAGRELASALASRIRELLHRARVPASKRARGQQRSRSRALPGVARTAKSVRTLHAIQRIVVHAGPGGFTSLRIGVTTANALAYALGIPVVGVTGEAETLEGLFALSRHVRPAPRGVAVPLYAKPPRIGRLSRGC